jgi:hypothetical protein
LANITVPALEIPDAITLTIAKDDGFFKAQGLNVTIDPVAASDNLVPSLLAHTYGITSENYVGMFEEESKTPELQLKVIADDLRRLQASSTSWSPRARRSPPFPSSAARRSPSLASGPASARCPRTCC